MDTNAITKACTLAGRTGYALIATAGRDGRPHLAAARKIADAGKSRVEVTEWFCPGTIENLGDNKQVSVVVWDNALDRGLQLLGRVCLVDNAGMLDGYDPATQEAAHMPQVHYRLVVEVERALTFTSAPHGDTEIEAAPAHGGKR